MPKKLIQALLVGGVAAAVSLALWSVGILDKFEGTTWSWRVKYFAKPGPQTSKIKLIFIDQASLDWADRENGLKWTWPREVYVPIIDFCIRGGAKTIAFDMLFTESSGTDLVSQDEALGSAVARASNFVTTVFLGKQASQHTTWPPFLKRPDWRVEGLDSWKFLAEPGAAFPIPQVATNAALIANVKDVPDIDSVFRRTGLLRIFDGSPIPSLGLATYLQNNPQPLRIEKNAAHLGDMILPVDKLGRVLLNFRGPTGTHEAFNAAAIIQSELNLQSGGTPSIKPEVLKNCYVFLGVTAPGLMDLKTSPISPVYPGVEIHATVLDNLLAGDFLKDVTPKFVVIGTVIPAIIAAFLILICRATWQMVIVFVVLLAAPWVRGYAAYPFGYWWPIIEAEFGIALSLTSAVVLSYATEGRQKRFIKSAFNQYVGEEVLDEMTRDPSKLRLGGEKKEITMFFSDLEKFSSFSERLEPPRLIELLNVYLTEMGQVIKQETGGYLDKFVGDAIVAFWNGPVAQPDHATRAVRAAILCQRRLAEKRDEWAAQYNAVLKMRIGIGTGEVVVGNMGSADKFNYTMLGDAANASSRLEGSNKAFGTYTLVSDVTWAQAGSAVVGREIGAIRVVGRKTPVRVYEPMGLAGESVPSWMADFEKGVAHCRGNRWKEALAIFEKIPNDHPSEVYAQRCRELISGAMREWDGVWNLTEK